MKKGNRLYPFIICFAISVFLWLLIKLSGDFKESNYYPVEVKYPFKDKVLVAKSDSKVYLTYKRSGFRISFFNFFKEKHPITIDLTGRENFRSNKIYLKLKDYISTADMHKNNLLNENIISVEPDTLICTFRDIYSKLLPVKLNLDISYDAQYDLYEEIKVSPDSVLVRGNKQEIDKLKYVQSDKYNFKKVKDYTNSKIKLLKPNIKDVSLIPEEVSITIPVEKFTEGKAVLPINIINTKSSETVKIFPPQVEITFNIALKDYPKFKNDMLVPVVDLNNTYNNNQLNVILKSQPEFVKIIRINPAKVEYVKW